MTTEELEALKTVFTSVLDERRSIDADNHQKDHQFVHELRLKARRRDDLIENTKKQVFGWATIGVLGFFGYSILLQVKTTLIKLLNLG